MGVLVCIRIFQKRGAIYGANEIYTQVDEIQDAIGMSDEDAERMKEIVAEYPMAVTDYYLP